MTSQLAVDYFSSCPESGLACVRALVLSRSPSDDSLTRKLVDICARHDLQPERRSVLNEAGMRALRQRRYGSAVHWFVRAKNAARIAQICEWVVEEYLGRPDRSRSLFLLVCWLLRLVVCSSLLGLSRSFSLRAFSFPLPHCMHLSPCVAFHSLCVVPSGLDDIEAVVENAGDVAASGDLAFLSKFRDLVLLVAETRRQPPPPPAELHALRRAAVEVLVRILVFKVAPRRYWARLLLDAVPLLESADDDAPLLSADDTYKLMACVEELVQSHHSKAYLAGLAAGGAAADGMEEEPSAAAGGTAAAAVAVAGRNGAEDQLQLVRLALMRNLTRAVLQ